MLYGQLENPKDIKVQKVTVEDMNKKTIWDAKIINKAGSKIWFLFLDKNHGSTLRIIRLSKNNKIVSQELLNVQKNLPGKQEKDF